MKYARIDEDFQHHQDSDIFPDGMTAEEEDIPVRELLNFKPLLNETKVI